jgi:hypothetical protein
LDDPANPTTTLMLVPWAIGTAVKAYPRRSELKLPDMPPPMVAAVATQNVGADQSVTFGPGLDPGEYWAIAPLTPGQRDYRYVGFSIEAPDYYVPGPAGPQGPQGPIGPQGPAQGLRWLGDWDYQRTYQLGEAVGYGGAAWAAIAISPAGTVPPATPAIWSLLADKGQQGPTGPAPKAIFARSTNAGATATCPDTATFATVQLPFPTGLVTSSVNGTPDFVLDQGCLRFKTAGNYVITIIYLALGNPVYVNTPLVRAETSFGTNGVVPPAGNSYFENMHATPSGLPSTTLTIVKQCAAEDMLLADIRHTGAAPAPAPGAHDYRIGGFTVEATV